MDAAEFKAALSEMVAVRGEEVEKLVRKWTEARAAGRTSELGPLELQMREWMLALGRTCMERVIHGIAAGSPQKAATCPKCGGSVASEGMRGATLHTSMGEVKYERRYLVCSSCQAGFCPLDAELGVDEQRNSPALQRMVALAGTVGPFEKGSELLGEIGSIPMGAQKVEQITEQAGTRVEAWLATRQERALAGLEGIHDSTPKRLYAEADGTTVPMRAEGETRSEDQRTPGKVEYKEVKLGAVFDATVDESGNAQAGEKTYTGTFKDAEVCVRQVVAEAKARGSEKAEEIVLLNDGGAWLWNRLPQEFPGKKVTQILDWCHPSERLGAISAWVHGDGTTEAKQWAEHERDLLYDGKVADVIHDIESLKPSGKEAKEFVRQSLGYFQEHAHRMNYAELRANGYFIGSGVIESACKHIVNARFKQAGMKWSREHAPKVLALRICRASGWWERFWKGGLRSVAA